MFRQSLLPRAYVILALSVAVLAVPLAARGQDGATEERLDRLERDLNMLQRQVYRGGPPPPAGSGEAVNLEVRMERLEAQMRDLTGRVEEVMNRIDQLRQRVEQVNGDVDMRLGQAPGRAGPPAAGAPPRPGAELPPGYPPAPPGDADDSSPPPRQFSGPGPADTPGAPTPIFGTLTLPGGAAPPPANAAPPGPNPAGGMLPNGSSAEQYNYAFGLLKKADYPAAEGALKAFVERHPKDALAGSAQYWLGETYYARQQYIDAASAFAEGYKRWPRSAKAPDNLLKLGMALGHAKQKQNACLALEQLDRDFPHPGAAVQQRAEAEKKRLGC
jgi:tol-pal system protein YbgF